MSDQHVEPWEHLASQARALAKDGKPDEAAQLLAQVPTHRGAVGYMHEKALAWIDVGGAYLAAGLYRDAETSVVEATRTIDAFDDGTTWEAGACRLELAQLLVKWQKSDEAADLAVKVARDSVTLQDRDVDSLKNICASGRLLAAIGRVQQSRDVLALVANEQVRVEELARLRAASSDR